MWKTALALLAVIAGCGSTPKGTQNAPADSGGTVASTGDSSQIPEIDSGPNVSPSGSVDGQVTPVDSAASMPDAPLASSGPDAGGAVGMDSSSSTAQDAASPSSIPYCPQVDGLSISGNGCGFLDKDATMINLWKDGHVCVTCTTPARVNLDGCLVPRQGDTGSAGSGPDLCVAHCRTECCFMRPNTACESESQCCAPLHCMDNGPGLNRTCR